MKMIHRFFQIISFGIILSSYAMHGMDQHNNAQQSPLKFNKTMAACIAGCGLIGGLAHVAIHPEDSTVNMLVASGLYAAYGVAAGYSINFYRGLRSVRVAAPQVNQAQLIPHWSQLHIAG